MGVPGKQQCASQNNTFSKPLYQLWCGWRTSSYCEIFPDKNMTQDSREKHCAIPQILALLLQYKHSIPPSAVVIQMKNLNAGRFLISEDTKAPWK